MAENSAIANIGEALIALLREHLGRPRNEVALASPESVDDGDRLRLTLYLYRVAQNADLKNARRSVADDDLRDPPLALDLYYLLTAHPAGGSDDQTGRSMDQHQVLGHAMQVLHDHAVLRGSALDESLANRGEEVRVTMNPTDQSSFDQLLSVWNTFRDQPYQPSVSYLVSPVLIESTETRPAGRVLERRDQYQGSVDRE